MALGKAQMTGIVFLLALIFSPGAVLTIPHHDKVLGKYSSFSFFSCETNRLSMIVHSFVIAGLFLLCMFLSDYSGFSFPGMGTDDSVDADADDADDADADVQEGYGTRY